MPRPNGDPATRGRSQGADLQRNTNGAARSTMNPKIETLTVDDLPAVDELMKRNSGTLGFLPGEALRQFLGDGHVLGAKDDSGTLGAYLLYATPR